MQKLDIERTYFNIIKVVYDKLTANTSFFSKIRKKRRMPTLTSPIQHSTKSPSQSNQVRKGYKITQIGRLELKLSFLQMI